VPFVVLGDGRAVANVRDLGLEPLTGAIPEGVEHDMVVVASDSPELSSQTIRWASAWIGCGALALRSLLGSASW
jgi:hypothetical protein